LANLRLPKAAKLEIEFDPGPRINGACDKDSPTKSPLDVRGVYGCCFNEVKDADSKSFMELGGPAFNSTALLNEFGLKDSRA